MSPSVARTYLGAGTQQELDTGRQPLLAPQEGAVFFPQAPEPPRCSQRAAGLSPRKGFPTTEPLASVRLAGRTGRAPDSQLSQA